MTDYWLASDCTWEETRYDLARTMRLWGVADYNFAPAREPGRKGSQAVAVRFAQPPAGKAQTAWCCWRWVCHDAGRAVRSGCLR